MSLIMLVKYPSYEDAARGELIGPSSHIGKFFRRCYKAAGRKAGLQVRPRLTSILPEPETSVEKLFTKSEVDGNAWPKCGLLGKPANPGAFSHTFERIKGANCILAIGLAPTYLTLGQDKVTALRGTVQWSNALKCKVIPTYDLDSVYADWSLRSAFTFDISKAIAESQYPEIRLRERILTMATDIIDIKTYFKYFDLNGSIPIAVDVETEDGQITSIAFATSPERALVVPFWDKSRPNYSFWPEVLEPYVWSQIGNVLEGTCPKIFHNGVYDLSYIQEKHYIKVNGPIHDSMLQSHSLQPELLKSLGHLGSLHTNESAWKMLNKTKKKDITKSEE